jgi:hypothetical protein
MQHGVPAGVKDRSKKNETAGGAEHGVFQSEVA